MTIDDRKRAMIWGGFVADAASMGLHWVYDQDRIRKVAPDTPEFRAPTAADYEGVAGYFAHGARQSGDLSQYGEQGLVMMRALAGGHARARYQRMFREHFGYGGAYVGYIDRPTRETLDKMTAIEARGLAKARAVDPSIENGLHAAIVTRVTTSRATTEGAALDQAIAEAVQKYSEDEALVAYALRVNAALEGADELPGADDVQLPAVSKLPALVACCHDAPNFREIIEEAVRVTNNSDVAVAWADVAAQMLKEVLETGSKPNVARIAAAAPPEINEGLTAVMGRESETTEVVTADIGLPCYLRMGIPSVAHNALRSQSFEEGVRANIYAGGDSCGRAMILGAMLGGLFGVPEDWIARVRARKDIEAALNGADLA